MFEHLRPKPLTTITSAWGHALVDALEQLYNADKQLERKVDETRAYADTVVTGLGVSLFLLDEADPDVPAYKSMSVTMPELPEVYVEATSDTAGDVLVAAWIAPADFTVLKMGVITAYLQAERVSGNIDVKVFFRLYERDATGTETLIAESTLSDLITERGDVFMNLVLQSDYVLSAGNRLVVKLYVRFLSSGTPTTVRLYYQGTVRSRLTLPISKEILDALYVPYTGARRDLDLNGRNLLNARIDASLITSGVLALERIPNIDWGRISGNFPRDISDLIASPFSRSWISDFFSAPFWGNIPDKPFEVLGSEFRVSDGELQIAGIDAGKITSGVLSIDRIPNLPRSKITDFFSTPFWDNIPDKPSRYPPEPHASEHSKGGSDELSLDASQITSGTLDPARIPGLDASKIVSGRLSLSRLPTSSIANTFLVVRTPNSDPVFDTLKASDIPNLDASKITSGVFDVARIPDLPRSKITDFFSTPFWDNIPDKPSTFPPSAHTHPRSDITDFFSSPFWDNIPDKPSAFPPEPHASTHAKGGTDELSLDASQITSGVLSVDRIPDLSRSKITDFFSAPFWDNIPDKPSTFPPEPHASTHRPGGSDALFPANYNLEPASDNAYDLGNPSHRWRDGYFAGTINLGNADNYIGIVLRNSAGERALFLGVYSDGTGWIDADKPINVWLGGGNIREAGHITPLSDNAYDLGTSTLRWRTCYLATSLGIGAAPEPPLHITNFRSFEWAGWHEQLRLQADSHSAITYYDPANDRGWLVGFHGTDKSIYIGWMDTWKSTGTYVLRIFSSGDVWFKGKLKNHLLPYRDNAYDLGSSSYRWRNVYAVNIYDVEHHTERLHTGDIIFKNGMRIVEAEPYGVRGLAILNREGRPVLFITEDGRILPGDGVVG